MKKFTIAAVVILGVLSASCAPHAVPITPATLTPTPTHSPTAFRPFTPTATFIPTATPTQTPSPTPTIPTPTPTPRPLLRPRYSLNGELDFYAHTITVEETLQYPNRSGTTLKKLVFDVEPNHGGGFVLQSAVIDGKKVPPSLSDTRLTLRLPKPLPPNSTTTVHLTYRWKIPLKARMGLFYYTGEQINLMWWYPAIVPRTSKGWLWHPYLPYGEHIAQEPSDFTLSLKIKDAPAGTTAVGSMPLRLKNGRWEGKLTNARACAVFISAKWQKTERQAGKTKVLVYALPSQKPAAEAVAYNVAKALLLYGKLFGLGYGRSTFTVAEASVSDGMEFSGAALLSEDYFSHWNGTVKDNLIALAVHETAHQWWYDKVGNDPALEPWLDEALATYSESLFYENEYHLQKWWWFFRVKALAPKGNVGMDIYHSGTMMGYFRAVYLHGAEFIAALRAKMGDKAFFAFLRDYARQMNGKLATRDDFFRILRAHTKVDLTPLIKAYLAVPIPTPTPTPTPPWPTPTPTPTATPSKGG